MTRLMYDSTTASDVPKDATMALGYVDGAYQTVPALLARRPKPLVITTTVNGSTHGANVIDRETGDASPQGAARWCRVEVDAGRTPTVYTYLSGVRDVIEELHKAGLTRDQALIFTAHYTGKPHFCNANCFKPYQPLRWKPRVIATQYANPAFTKHHYDVSLVRDYWPGVDPEPVTTPPMTGKHRQLVRDVTKLLNHRKHPLNSVDRKAIAALDAAALAALRRKS